jgi:hypothetical protein
MIIYYTLLSLKNFKQFLPKFTDSLNDLIISDC